MHFTYLNTLSSFLEPVSSRLHVRYSAGQRLPIDKVCPRPCQTQNTDAFPQPLSLAERDQVLAPLHQEDRPFKLVYFGEQAESGTGPIQEAAFLRDYQGESVLRLLQWFQTHAAGGDRCPAIGIPTGSGKSQVRYYGAECCTCSTTNGPFNVACSRPMNARCKWHMHEQSCKLLH